MLGAGFELELEITVVRVCDRDFPLSAGFLDPQFLHAPRLHLAGFSLNPTDPSLIGGDFLSRTGWACFGDVLRIRRLSPFSLLVRVTSACA